jgi:16S rRNA (guanine527-N7)-methyltransferase
MAIDKEILASGLEALGLPASGKLATDLARYGEEIERWNPAYGLVGAEGDELVIKHILDSLAPIAIIRERMEAIHAARMPDPEALASSIASGRAFAPLPLRLADLGSGAGLPGIPLALALPDLEVSLVERMARRAGFLEGAVALLGLANAKVVEREVERVEGGFELLTFRAFRPFERKLFKSVFALCEADGYVLAYKGRMEKARAELSEIEGLYSSAEILPVKVPFLDDERCLVALRPAAAMA